MMPSAMLGKGGAGWKSRNTPILGFPICFLPPTSPLWEQLCSGTCHPNPPSPSLGGRMVLPGQNGAPGSCVWFGPMAVAWGGFGGCPPPWRGGRGGSGVIHGLGQEQRKIWGFPPLAQSGLWVHGLPGLSRAGSDKGGQDTQAPTGCHRIPQNQGETPERDPDPSPMQATEVCRPARRELSVPVSLTLETSPSPVAWGGWGGGVAGGLWWSLWCIRQLAQGGSRTRRAALPRHPTLRQHPQTTGSGHRLPTPRAPHHRHGERGPPRGTGDRDATRP